VQSAVAACGISARRDSDMMEAALGSGLPVDDALANLKRGDLIFWRGHVGVMCNGETLLHANGWHMKVAREPLAEARTRIAETAGGVITSIRRL
jgi:cell wall-associated NlpC family hydrolase